MLVRIRLPYAGAARPYTAIFNSITPIEHQGRFEQSRIVSSETWFD